MSKVHFSSQRLDWKTPKAVYQILDAEFSFDFDPCPDNPKFDGLNIEWGEVNYVNPPYGRELSKWVEKGYNEWLKGKTVVFLIPSRTDTICWHKFCMKATEIRFIQGRLKFDDCENPAPFPSCIVIFKNEGERGRASSHLTARSGMGWSGCLKKEIV
ncbi:MAG: phage N-6-adenine-methyltransferase [Bacteroidales bacterium]|nr:phage N-6-adenine-methyltransferase [Bacteroidales bacterium]